MKKICQNPLCKKEFETNRPQKRFHDETCRKQAEKAYLYLDEGGNLPTILVDTREQNPFLFRKSPRCAGHEIAALPYGDYAIKGDINLIVVERKQSIDEIANNLFREGERFERELERMQSSKYRFIVVEGKWSDIFVGRRFTKMNRGVILDRICSLTIRYGVPIIFAEDRITAGRIIHSLLLAAVKNKNRGTLNNESNNAGLCLLQKPAG